MFLLTSLCVYAYISNLYKGKICTLVFTKIVNLFNTMQRFLFFVIPFFRSCVIYFSKGIIVDTSSLWNLMSKYCAFGKSRWDSFVHHHFIMSRCPVTIHILEGEKEKKWDLIWIVSETYHRSIKVLVDEYDFIWWIRFYFILLECLIGFMPNVFILFPIWLKE